MVEGAILEAVRLYHGVLFAGGAFMKDREAEPIDLERSIRAAKFESAIVDGGSHHTFITNIEPRIAERNLDCVRTFPLIENKFIREHVDFFGRVGFHGPVHDIDPVSAKIGHRAAAEIPVPAPAMEFLLNEWLLGRAAEPAL